jgi:hypothetical protein
MLLEAILSLEENQKTVTKTSVSQNRSISRKSYSESRRCTKINEDRNEQVISTIPTIITSKTIVGYEENKQTSRPPRNNIYYSRLD